jgi:hypothetical protein
MIPSILQMLDCNWNWKEISPSVKFHAATSLSEMGPHQDLPSLKDFSSSFVPASPNERWSIYRHPQRKYLLPPGVKTLRLPRARRSKLYDDIQVKKGQDLFGVIYNHYNSYLPDPQNYDNYCGVGVAVRRHEALSCDPCFGGFVFRQNVAHIVVYDDHLHDSWCLERME